MAVVRRNGSTMRSGRGNCGPLLGMDSQQTRVIKIRRGRKLYRWRIEKLDGTLDK